MSKPLIPRHWRPAVIIVASAFVVAVLDSSGLVNVPVWLLWAVDCVMWVAIWFAIIYGRNSSRPRRPKWAKDDD